MTDDEAFRDYGIGSKHLPGLAKLVEETGELQQVLAKIIASGTLEYHPDGSYLRHRVIEELGDVRAAMIYFCEANAISKAAVHERAIKKLTLYKFWHNKHRKTGRPKL